MSENNPVVIMETSLGNITIELFEKEAPVTVKNFLEYVDSGFYAGTIFHRVIKGFMVQGGGMEPNLHQKQGLAPIKNEAGNGLSNEIGTIAMARTSVINSATSQFFINTAKNTFLNHSGETPDRFGYCVFGKVISGMDVVRAIEDTKTTTSGWYSDVPEIPISISKVTRQK